MRRNSGSPPWEIIFQPLYPSAVLATGEMNDARRCGNSILLRFCIRGRGGDRRGHRGLLRGGGLALARFVCAATRNREKTGGGDAGKDDFFHIQFLLFGLFIYRHIFARRLVKGYQV
jgi:hypothetical protein